MELLKSYADVNDQVFEFIIPPGTLVTDLDTQIGYIEGEVL